VGQAPGVTEAQVKRPFNASSGRRLFQWLAQAGLEEADSRARYYMTAVTKCYPGKHPSGKGDRKPSRAEQKLCRPFLEQELALVQPRVLLAVGGLAIGTLLGQPVAQRTPEPGASATGPGPAAGRTAAARPGGCRLRFVSKSS